MYTSIPTERAPRALPGARSRSSRISGGRPHPEARTRVEAIVLRKDVILRVKPERPRVKRAHERGDIRAFSFESAKNFRRLLRNTSDMWKAMVTLTYPGDSLWWNADQLQARRCTRCPEIERAACRKHIVRPCKEHVRAFTAWLSRRKLAYVWMLEFQERGVPHFHFLIAGRVDKNELSRRWYEIVSSGDPRHLAAGTGVQGVKDPDHAGAYLGSYLTKLGQKTVPEGFEKVGRFWGASRCLKKELLVMEGSYDDLSPLVGQCAEINEDKRLDISISQLEQAKALRKKARDPAIFGRRREKIERAAGRCERRAESYAQPWDWKGYGFTLVNGADFFRERLRGAVLKDSGGWSRWQEWDGKAPARRPYVNPQERGQLMLDGTLAREYWPDRDCEVIEEREGRGKDGRVTVTQESVNVSSKFLEVLEGMESDAFKKTYGIRRKHV